MPDNHFSNSIRYIKGLLSDDLSNNTLNPYKLAFATRCYKIQSQLLIPDRYGYFASGTPRLQMWQAHEFVVSTFLVSFISCFGFLITMGGYLSGRPVFGLAICFAVMTAGLVALLYALGVQQCRNPPDFLGLGERKQKEL